MADGDRNDGFLMCINGTDQASISGVPELQAIVVAAANQLFPVRRELQAPYGEGMTR